MVQMISQSLLLISRMLYSIWMFKKFGNKKLSSTCNEITVRRSKSIYWRDKLANIRLAFNQIYIPQNDIHPFEDKCLGMDSNPEPGSSDSCSKMPLHHKNFEYKVWVMETDGSSLYKELYGRFNTYGRAHYSLLTHLSPNPQPFQVVS